MSGKFPFPISFLHDLLGISMSDDSPNTDLSTPNTERKLPLIGSQRNPEAFRPVASSTSSSTPAESVAESVTPTETEPAVGMLAEPTVADEVSMEKVRSKVTVSSTEPVRIPKIRGGKMSDDLEDEFNAIFGGGSSMDDLLEASAAVADQEVLESDSKIKATVISIRGDGVFLDLGAREQGVVSMRMFPVEAEPQPGQKIDVTVIRFNQDEGLYEVSVPLAAADVRDWSQVHEGMVVEAKITKTNAGGLECEVNRLRGFIPISQIELFRVENTEQYVGQKLVCIVEEVNPERRNLVLSRRAMLNREREELREKLLAELEVGQTREGLVRKIIDAGVFVDLGGVDGFIPISALSWGRVNHPSDVIQEGTRVKVRISKIDTEANRISLVYRDDAANPWSNISQTFPEKTVARGKVTKITEFGAFIELMPGLEGLVHISELSPKRVNNVREVVREGEWVDVFILSADPDARRMSLSIKQAMKQDVAPEAVENEESLEPEPMRTSLKMKNLPKGPLKGGVDKPSGGEQFGLKW